MEKISTFLVNFGMATQKPTMSNLESIDYLYDLIDVASTKISSELVKKVKISTFGLFLTEH